MSNIASAAETGDVCGFTPKTSTLKEPVAEVGGYQDGGSNAVMGADSLIWEPNTVITYSFLEGTKNQKKAVDAVAPEWFKYAGLELKKCEDKDPEALVRITFNPRGGAWSYIGKSALDVKDGKATMNLGCVDDSPTISNKERGIILHEWGHALGMMHEHQSMARGEKLHLKVDAVKEHFGLGEKWSDAQIQSQILNVHTEDAVSNFSKFDLHSVMMYWMPGSLNEEGITVHQNIKLSDLDKAYMVIHYPKEAPHPEASEWTLEKALTVAEVSPEMQKDILHNREDHEAIRYLFNIWNKISRAKYTGNQSAPSKGNQSSAPVGNAPRPPPSAIGKTSATVKGACGLAPEKALEHPTDKSGTVNDPNVGNAVLAKVALLWEPNTVISYSFFGGTQHQKNAVNKVVPEWFKYVKLYLEQQADNDEEATVRITFNPNGGSWSCIGTGALNVKDGKPTMNLGWIEDSVDISENDRGTILHEWGHALGLMHEHQSPARGGTLHLKQDAVKEYYSATQGWPDSLIQSQILDIYSQESVSNFSKLDTTSIMMYFMPGSLNQEGVTVNVNNKLSDLDKAYMVINYPKGAPHPEAPEWTLEHALEVAGVPADKRRDILDCRKNVDELRSVFSAWIKKSQIQETGKAPTPTPSNPTSSQSGGEGEISRLLQQILSGSAPQAVGHALAPSGAPAGVEHGIWSAITSVLKSPAFREIASNVVDVALTQRGLSPTSFSSGSPVRSTYDPSTGNVHAAHSIYNAQMGLRSSIANTLEDPKAQQAIAAAVDNALTQHGINAGDSAVDIQQGLISGFISIVGHPMVRNALSGVVDAVLGQRGLNPATAAQYPEIQQGVWTGLLGVLKNPAFQKVVTSVVDSTLTQRGIKPAPPPTGYGIFTDIGKLLTHPAVTTTLTNLINTTLKGHGLDPHNAAMYNPEIQQGIWTNIVDVLKHPMFQKVVGTVVSSTMQQHGLNPSGKPGSASAELPDDVQQGIWSAIGSVFEHPVFKTVVEGAVNVAVGAAGLLL